MKPLCADHGAVQRIDRVVARLPTCPPSMARTDDKHGEELLSEIDKLVDGR